MRQNRFRTIPPLAVSLDEAAGMIGISTRHMRRLAKRGDLVVCQVGRRVVVEIPNIKKFLAERRMVNASDQRPRP